MGSACHLEAFSLRSVRGRVARKPREPGNIALRSIREFAVFAPQVKNAAGDVSHFLRVSCGYLWTRLQFRLLSGRAPLVFGAFSECAAAAGGGSQGLGRVGGHVLVSREALHESEDK